MLGPNQIRQWREPLHHHELANSAALPVADQQRKVTDVCCLILGIIFGLILFIVACTSYSSYNLKKSNYPADSQGKVCMIDTQTGVNNYPFLFFNDVNDPSNSRHCVTECPEKGVATHCYDNCTITYYPNYPSSTRLGAFCLPEDDHLKTELLYKAKITQRFNNLKALDYMLGGLGIAFGISIIWLLIVQFLPKAAFWIALLISALMLFVAMLVFFIGSGNTLVDGQGWAIIMGLICLGMLVIVVLYSIFNRRQIYLVGCFLQIAGQQLREHWSTLIWVPIFIGISFLFGLLIVFQYLAFSSSGSMNLQKGSVYYSTVSTWFNKLVLVIETLWGLSFFRDMFNYIISGLTCEWYFKKETHWYTPLRRLFCKNLGSVAGGSFLSSLFFIPSMIISFFFPNADSCFCNFFDLTRSDVYSYMYLTGNSYCPSSRQCQYLCSRSAICKENESVIAVYAFVVRIVLALVSVMIAYWIARDNLVESKVPPYLLLGIFFACLYVTCYCSDLHALIAEAVLICFLLEEDLQDNWSYAKMRYCPLKLRELVTDIDKKQEYGLPFPYSNNNNPTAPK